MPVADRERLDQRLAVAVDVARAEDGLEGGFDLLVVGNKVIADGLMRAGQQVSAGASITECFHNLGIFPPLVIRMLRVGETTGALDVALRNVNYFYTRDVRESVDKALKLLEPTITLGLGLVLAFIDVDGLKAVNDGAGHLRGLPRDLAQQPAELD